MTHTGAPGILVVDDTPANLTLLARILMEQGYPVRVAPNGRLALQSACAQPPDLVLLDIRMPEMDGYTVCKELKANPLTAKIPVIFLSALTSSQDKLLCFDAGGVDYISKPFDTPEVLARVATHLRLHALQTELEKNNAALLAAKENLSRTLSAIPDMLLELGLDGRCYSVHSAHPGLPTATPELMLHQLVTDLLPADAAAICLQALQEANTAGNSSGRQFSLAFGQAQKWFELSIARKVDVPAEGARFIVLCRDITERKEVEHLKNEFVSLVSHELRTPLTSIRGSLGLVAGGVAGELPAQVKSLIDVAYRNSERLVSLINDILDIEKISSGKMHFELSRQELMPLILQAVESNEGYAAQLKVHFNIARALPDAEVNVDAGRLIQVLSNLLSNAAKFSPPGAAVDIEVTRHADWIRVAVIDYGSGIPKEFRNKIFQKFSQADSSETRMKGGTGLGLSISKAMLENMAGKIDFDSRKDLGTRFYFDLPQVRASEPGPEQTMKQRLT